MARVECAVDDALEMRVDEDFRNFSRQYKHILNGQFAFVMNKFLETGSIEEFHKDDGGITFFFNFKNFYEIRMI